MGFLNKVADELRKPRPKFEKGCVVIDKLSNVEWIVRECKWVDGGFVYQCVNKNKTEYIDEVMLKRKLQLGY